MKVCDLLWLPINKASQILSSAHWNTIIAFLIVALELIRIDFDVVYGNLNLDFFFFFSVVLIVTGVSQFVWEATPSVS